jgi:hypothetical protein
MPAHIWPQFDAVLVRGHRSRRLGLQFGIERQFFAARQRLHFFHASTIAKRSYTLNSTHLLFMLAYIHLN